MMCFSQVVPLRSRTRPGVGLVTFWALLLTVLGPSGSLAAETATDRRVFTLDIRERAIAGGTDVIRVTQGESAELRWTTDEVANIHLHGYDIELSLTPGTVTVMTVDARATGRFPITSHGFGGGPGQGHTEHHHSPLLYLEVYPR